MVRVAAMVTQFGFNLAVARSLGAEGVGHYYIFLAAVIGLGVFAKYGTDVSVIRLLAQAGVNKNADQPATLESIWFGLFIFVNLAVAIVGLVWLLAVHYLPVLNGLQNWQWLIVVALITQTLLAFSCAALRGLKMPVAAAIIESLAFPLLNTLALLKLYFFETVQVDALLYNYIGASALLYLVAQVLLLKKMRLQHIYLSSKIFKTTLASNVPLLSIAVLTYFSGWSTTWIIGAFLNPESVGIYNICWRLVVVSGFIGLAIKNINAPYFSRLYAEGNVLALQARVSKASAVLLGISLPLFCLMAVFAQQLLHIFGSEFESGLSVLYVLLAGQLFRTCCGPVGYLLLMTGHDKDYTLINIVSALYIVLSSLLLVGDFGLMGVAVSYSIGVSLQNIFAWFTVRKKLGVVCMPMFIQKVI